MCWGKAVYVFSVPVLSIFLTFGSFAQSFEKVLPFLYIFGQGVVGMGVWLRSLGAG